MNTLEVVEIQDLSEIKTNAYKGFFYIPAPMPTPCYILTFLKDQPSPENPNIREVLSETISIFLNPSHNIKTLEDYTKNKVFLLNGAQYTLLEVTRLF